MENNVSTNQDWTTIIEPKTKLLSVDFREIWQHRDLIRMFIRRNFNVMYKQTILGPLWFIIQPVLTVVMYMVVFGNIAQISTDGIPQPLFYLAGITIWSYFASCFSSCANALVGNASIFSKVYFPRLCSPISSMITALLPFSVNMLIFMVIYGYYCFFTDAVIKMTWGVFLIPFIVMLVALMGAGIGLFLSSITTKYRDLTILISFAFRLWMYATPIIYPLSTIDNEHLRIVMYLNPMTGLVEFFKWSFLSVGAHEWWLITYSIFFCMIMLTLGVVVFNQAQRTFMDTV
jgi:lipopolysaccharide transport system permease protein